MRSPKTLLTASSALLSWAAKRARRPVSGYSSAFPCASGRKGSKPSSRRRSALGAVARSRHVMEPVNLFSDTQTRPTAEMRRAMAEAEVGDEQRFDDPTVNRLQERVAELLGKEAALFLPSGTMCNAIGFRLHLRPGGDEVSLDRTSHPVQYEAGGPA